jgi:zinc protease
MGSPMHKPALSLLLGLGLAPLAMAASVPDADYKLRLDPYQIDIRDFQFPSGLRIMFQSERTQPVVQITAVIDRGSEHDQPGADGIAHVVEHLAFRAQHGDLPKNWDLIAQLGGSINASTSVDWTNYMTVAPVDAAPSLLRIEALRLKDGVANVTEEDVRLETEIARNELRMRYENAAIGEGWDAIAAALYPKTSPYARSTIGSHETLSNITLPLVQEFTQKNYRPEYTTIMVVGDFDTSESWRMVTQAFEGLEDLWMAPDDAKAYAALKTEAEQIAYLKEWMPKLEATMAQARTAPRKPRVDCANRAEPPPPQSQVTARVRGVVDAETVLTAWSLPAGYCSDETDMYIAASLLTNYIQRTLDPEWDYAKQESSIEGLGCFPDLGRYHSTLICYVEPSKGAGLKPEKLIEKVADSLYLQWDREMMTNPVQRAFVDWNFRFSRAQAMAGQLLTADLVASLFSGRSFDTAMFAHFTGDPALFSYRMKQYAAMELYPVQELARKYLTRDRMISVIVEPMDENERARREATANSARSEVDQPTYSGLSDAGKYNFVFDVESITPEAIERVTVVPKRAAMREFKLDNGLNVLVMPYGEAPIVRAALLVEGNDYLSSPWGLDAIAEQLYSTGGSSKQEILAVAGSLYPGKSSIVAEGSSGNLDALLNKMRWQVEDYDWNMAAKKTRVKKRLSDVKKDGKEAATWAGRMREARLWPDHPLGTYWTPEAVTAIGAASTAQFQDWIYRKWQPANAELIVVGRVDADEAEAAVRKYFGEWAAKGGVPVGALTPVGPPSKTPDRQVLVFHDKLATQTDVLLSCQIDAPKSEDRAKAQVVGEVLSELAWRTLREQSGVTYGAGAYPQFYKAGANGAPAALRISSLVQNDATGFALQTMFDIVAQGAKGDVPDNMVVAARWAKARTAGIYMQSGDQMLSTLMGVGIKNLSFYDHYAKDLGRVTKADFPGVLAPCVGHEVVTLVGPKEYAEAQLKERNIPYEVVDWEALYQAQLTKKELKKYLKAKAEEEAKAAQPPPTTLR